MQKAAGFSIPIMILALCLMFSITRSSLWHYGIVDRPDNVPVTQKPDPNGDPPLVTLPAGTIVSITNSYGNYSHVDKPIVGWIRSESLHL